MGRKRSSEQWITISLLAAGCGAWALAPSGTETGAVTVAAVVLVLIVVALVVRRDRRAASRRR